MTAIDAVPGNTKRPARPPNLKPHRRTAVVVGVAAAGALAAIIASGPKLDLLFRQPMVIQIHVYAAVASFILGAVMLLARKGRAFHIAGGWTWVTLMTITAGASLFITGINGDYWSWIHILSGSTLLSLPLGVMLIKKGKVNSHRFMMTQMYIGAMVVAGGFTFLPGRLMWDIFLG